MRVIYTGTLLDGNGNSFTFRQGVPCEVPDETARRLIAERPEEFQPAPEPAPSPVVSPAVLQPAFLRQVVVKKDEADEIPFDPGPTAAETGDTTE